MIPFRFLCLIQAAAELRSGLAKRVTEQRGSCVELGGLGFKIFRATSWWKGDVF